MIRLKVGSAPLLVSQFSVPNFVTENVIWGAGSGNLWRGFCNFNASSLSKINSINSAIASNGRCGKLIPFNNNQSVPANGQLLIITSTDFNPTSQSFNNLMDTLYVVLHCVGNKAIHFANYITSSTRRLILNHTLNRDIIICNCVSLLKQDQTAGDEDGTAVNFTFADTLSYVNNGCLDSSSKIIILIPKPIPSFSPTQTRVCEQSAPNLLNPLVLGGNFSGNAYISGNLFDPKLAGSYKLVYTIQVNGCIDSSSQFITVDPMPNASFTLSDTLFCMGDGLNELYGAVGFGLKEYNLFIYNRWGELLFTSEQINQRWDGRFREKECAEGVYFFILSAASNAGRSYNLNGTLQLLS